MKRAWVVFYTGDKELLRYTLVGEMDGEREETIAMLAYENDIAEDSIECCVVVR